MTLRQRLKCAHFFEFGKKNTPSYESNAVLKLGHPIKYAMHETGLVRVSATPMLTVGSVGCRTTQGEKTVYAAKPIYRGLTFILAATTVGRGKVSTGPIISPLHKGLAKLNPDNRSSGRDTPYPLLSPLTKIELGILAPGLDSLKIAKVEKICYAYNPLTHAGCMLPLPLGSRTSGSLSTRMHSAYRLGSNPSGVTSIGLDRVTLRVLPRGTKVLDSNELAGEDIFWNVCFDKGRLKNFVSWFLQMYGEYKTIHLVEQLKNVGFEYATKAGISLGIEDLKIPPRKAALILEAEKLTKVTITQYNRGEISGVERFQRLIDTWHRTSELLKQEVIDHFEVTDILNPVYMMAFSGARGNISQVRQLVGMRGLMADPQGQIIDFPIRSNFREGLTLTEYIISSYGARKGIVDTALRTANAGYLTRRLVDVAQHVVVSQYDCGTNRGLFLTEMKESNKIIYSLQNRLIGRVLAKDIYKSVKGVFSDEKIASRNQEVSTDLAFTISKNCTKVFVRSSLTCETKKLVCQLCYGWSLAQGSLVSIGEAIGIVAAQSIGEPGTQLTMRTFHTGGVFSGDVSEQIRAPYNGYVQYSSSIAGTLIRTAEGRIAFLTKHEAMLFVLKASYPITIFNHLSLVNANGTANNPPPSHTINTKDIRKYKIPAYTVLFIRNNENVIEKQVIAQISSVSRQKNIRDDAELTIRAEMEGQFYLKTLSLQRNFVGPKWTKKKPPDHKLKKLMEWTKLTDKMIKTILTPIVEARDWDLAWILSGKIYELPMPTSFFPQQGDFINTSCTVNQTRWLLAAHGGMVSYLYVSNFELNKKRKVAFMRSIYSEVKYPKRVKDELQKLNKDSLQGLGNLEENKKVTRRTPNVHFLSLRAKLTGGNNQRVTGWRRQPYPYGVHYDNNVPYPTSGRPDSIRNGGKRGKGGEFMLPGFAKVALPQVGEKKFSKPNKTPMMGMRSMSRSFSRKAHPSFVKKPVFFLNIKKIQYHNIGYVLDIASSTYFGYTKDSSLPFPVVTLAQPGSRKHTGVSPTLPTCGKVGRGERPSLVRGSTFAHLPPVLTPSSVGCARKNNDFIFTAHSLQPKGIIHNQSTLQNYQSSKDNEYTWRRRTDFVASLGQSHKSLSPSISAAGESKSELFSQEFGENMVKHKSNYNGSMASNNKQNALSLSATNWNPSMSKFIQWLPQNSSIKTAGLFIFENTIKSVTEGWLGVSLTTVLKTLHQKPTPISPLSLNIKEGFMLAGHSLRKKVKIKPIFMKWFKQPNIYLANSVISNITSLKNHYQVSYKKKYNWFNTNHENRSLMEYYIGGGGYPKASEAVRVRSEVQFHTPHVNACYVYSPFVNPPLAIQNLSYLYPTHAERRNKASKTSPHSTWLPGCATVGLGHPTTLILPTVACEAYLGGEGWTASHATHKGSGQGSITSYSDSHMQNAYGRGLDRLPEVHSKIRLTSILGRVVSATWVVPTQGYNSMGRLMCSMCANVVKESVVFYIGKLLSNFILPPHYLGLHDQKDPKFAWGTTVGLEVNTKPHKGVSLQNPTSNNKFLATQRFFYMPQPCYKLNTWLSAASYISKQETSLHNPSAPWLSTAGLGHPTPLILPTVGEYTPLGGKGGTAAHARHKGPGQGSITSYPDSRMQNAYGRGLVRLPSPAIHLATVGKEAVKTKKPFFHINKNHYNSMRSYFFCVTTFKPFYLQTKDAFSINGLYLNPNQVKLGLYHSRTLGSLSDPTSVRPDPILWNRRPSHVMGGPLPYATTYGTGSNGGKVMHSALPTVGSGIKDLDKSSMPYYSNLVLTYPNLNELEAKVSSYANPVKGHATNPWHYATHNLFSSTSKVPQSQHYPTGISYKRGKGVEQKSEKYLERLYQEETKVAPTLLSYLKKRPGFFNSTLGGNSSYAWNPIPLLEILPLPPVPKHAKDTDIPKMHTVVPKGTKPATLKLLATQLGDVILHHSKGDNMDLKQRFGKNREWLEKDLKTDILLYEMKQAQSDSNLLLLNPYNVSLSIKNGLKTQKQPVKKYLLAATYWKKWNYSLQKFLVQTLFQTYSFTLAQPGRQPTFFYLKDKAQLLDLFYNNLLPGCATHASLRGLPTISQVTIGTTSNPEGVSMRSHEKNAYSNRTRMHSGEANACEIKYKKVLAQPNKNLSNSPYLYTTCNQRLCCFLENKMKKIPSFINKEIRFLLPSPSTVVVTREEVPSGTESLKMVNNLYSHVTFKKGWVYKPTNMSDALKYDKKVILAGELLLDHIIFDRLPSSAIYIECVHLKEKKTTHNLLSGFLWNKTRLAQKSTYGIKTKGYPYAGHSHTEVPVSAYTECVVQPSCSLLTGVTGSNAPSAVLTEIENDNKNLKKELLWIKNIKPRFGSSIFRFMHSMPIGSMGSGSGEGGLEIKYPNPFYATYGKHNTNEDACLGQNSAFVIIFRNIEQHNLIEPLHNKLNVQDLLLTSLQSIKIKPCLKFFSGKIIKTIDKKRELSNSSVLLSQPPLAALSQRGCLRHPGSLPGKDSQARSLVRKKIQIKSKVFLINKKLNSLSLQNLYRSAVFNKQLKTAEIVASLPNIDFYIEQNLLWEDLKLDTSTSNPTVVNPYAMRPVPDFYPLGVKVVAGDQATSFSPEATSSHFQALLPLEGGSLVTDPLYNQITKQKKSYSFAWSYRPLNFNSFTVNYKNFMHSIMRTHANTNEITLKVASLLAGGDNALPLLEPEKEAVASDSPMLRMPLTLPKVMQNAYGYNTTSGTGGKRGKGTSSISYGLRSNQGAHILFNYKKQAPFHVSFYKISIKNTPNWQCFSTLLKNLIQTGFLIIKKHMLWQKLPYPNPFGVTYGRGEVDLERTKFNLRKLRLKKDILSSIQSIIPILFDSPCLDLNIKSTLLVNKNGFFASKSINCSTTEGGVLSKKKELSKTKFYVSLGNNLISSTPVAQTSFFSAFEGELLTFSQTKLKRNPLLQSLKRQEAFTWHPLTPLHAECIQVGFSGGGTVAEWRIPQVVRLSKINKAYFGFDNFIYRPTSTLPDCAQLGYPKASEAIKRVRLPQATDIRLEQLTKSYSLDTKANKIPRPQVFANSCLILTKKDLVSFSSVVTQSSSTLRGIKEQGENKLKKLRLGDFYLHGDLLDPFGVDASNKITGLNVSGQIVHLSTVISPFPYAAKDSMGGGNTRTMLNIKKNHTGYSSFSLQNSAPTYPFCFKPLYAKHKSILLTVSMQKSGLEESTSPLTPDVVLPSLITTMGGNKDMYETDITKLQGGLPYNTSGVNELRTVITLRRAQPIFISPKGVFHVHKGDFIQNRAPVITLAYQRLKTGDIIEGIPKVEQFFEARTTKRGRLFKDSLPNLLKGLFERYRTKSLPQRRRDNNLQLHLQSKVWKKEVAWQARSQHNTLSLAQVARQSFYKIQQIIVDGVQRVYRSQGAAIADKHLEVIVRQMTSKVKIVKGNQTLFFPGELVDFEFIKHVNARILVKVQYQPVVVGITRASLQVNSFLSAASFQQTTRILSEAAINKRQDFLKGLKENVMLGNLIPTGTGYLVYLDC